MTISFSYAYLKGFDRLMVSSPWVQIEVHLPNRAMSPRITTSRQHFSTQHRETLAIHENGLSNIVCVVPSHNMIHAKHGSSSIQSLAPENPAKRAVIFLPDLRYNGIHGPSVQLVV
jgi:hypothetical protein